MKRVVMRRLAGLPALIAVAALTIWMPWLGFAFAVLVAAEWCRRWR
jgi:hypothetical protein